MPTNIRIKNSVTENNAPGAGDLQKAELALNINPNSVALYTKDNANNIVRLAGDYGDYVLKDDGGTKQVIRSDGLGIANAGGTENITLGSNGSSFFSTNVEVGNNSGAPRAAISSAGTVLLDTTQNNNGAVIRVRQTGNNVNKFSVTGDGGTFIAGTRGDASNLPKISLEANGSGVFSNDVTISRNNTANNGFFFSVGDTGAGNRPVVDIKGAGNTGLNAKALTVAWNDGGNESISLEYGGTGVFLEAVQAGGNPHNGGAVGCRIRKNGFVESTNNAGGNVFQAYLSGSNIKTATISAEGHATFGDPGAPITGQQGVRVFQNTSYNSQVSAFYAEQEGTGLLYKGATGPDQNDITFSVRANGNAVFAGNVTAANVSDSRFKENVSEANSQLDDVVALGGLLKNWDWNDEAPLNEELRSLRFLGLIAQEVEEISPGLVYTVERTKNGEMITPEQVVPAVMAPEEVVPEQVIDPIYETDELGNEVLVTLGRTIPAYTVEAYEIEPEKTIPAVYEQVDDSYKAIKTDVLVMKLLGAVAELQAEVESLKAELGA